MGNNGELIRANFVMLSTSLTFKDFINDIYGEKLISIYDYESLLCKNRIEQNTEFLLHMDMYGNVVQEVFMKWLKTNNVTLNSDFNKKDLNIIESLQFDRNIIRRAYVLFSKCLNARAIAPRLYENSLLNQEKFYEILQEPSRRRQVTLLLDRITNTRSFTCFINALSEYQFDLYKEFINNSTIV